MRTIWRLNGHSCSSLLKRRGGGVTGEMSRQILRLVVFPFIVVIGVIVCVPGEPLLVESDDNLWTLDIGLPGRHQVCLVTVFPAGTQTGKLQVKSSSGPLNHIDKCTVSSHTVLVTHSIKNNNKTIPISGITQQYLFNTLCPRPPALFSYCVTPDCPVTTRSILASRLMQIGTGFSRDL